MAGEHYIPDLTSIQTNATIVASFLKTVLLALDQKLFDILTGAVAHGYLRLGDFSELTIASGVVTATGMCHTIASESGTTDTLDTINITPTGVQMLVLKAKTGHTITITHNVGNLKFGSGTNFSLQGDKRLILFRDGSVLYDAATSATAGGASVSSVGLSAPAILSVAGSPITTSGTLALTLATQVKNKIWAGPTTGSDATPTFRDMVLADLPSIADAKLVGNGSGGASTPVEVSVGTGLQLISNSLSVVGGAAAGGEGVGGNIVTNGGFRIWERGISAAPDGWVLTGSGATMAQEATIIKMGDYSAKVTRVGNDCHLSFDAYVAGQKTYMRNRAYVFGAWVYATVASRVRLRMNDGTTTTYSSYHTGGSAWEWLTVTATVGNSATAFNVGLAVDTGNTSGYMDGASLAEGSTMTYPIAPALAFNRFPRTAVVFPYQLTQPNGTPGITYTVNTSQPFNIYATQTTAANGDSYAAGVYLEEGTYTMKILGITGVAGAKVTFSIDGVDQASLTNIDYYSGSTVYNVLGTGSVTVIGSGYHVIKATVTGRNGSNTTGWNWFMSMITLVPSTY